MEIYVAKQILVLLDGRAKLLWVIKWMVPYCGTVLKFAVLCQFFLGTFR